jgi:hypothetical protein
LGRRSQRQSVKRRVWRRDTGATQAARPPPYRTPRPASVCRSTRRGPLPLAPHRPAPHARARHASPTRCPTSGRAAILAGAHPRRGRPTAHAALCTAPLTLVCKEHPNASKLDYKSASPYFTRGNTAPPSLHCRPSVLMMNSTSGHFSPQARAASTSSCTDEAPTSACWPRRAAGSPEQSSQWLPAPVPATPDRRLPLRRE